MDWLLQRQGAIEGRLAKRHFTDGTLVLCDVTSTWLEGCCCLLVATAARATPSVARHSTCSDWGCSVPGTGSPQTDDGSNEPMSYVNICPGSPGQPMRNRRWPYRTDWGFRDHRQDSPTLADHPHGVGRSALIRALGGLRAAWMQPIAPNRARRTPSRPLASITNRSVG